MWVVRRQSYERMRNGERTFGRVDKITKRGIDCSGGLGVGIVMGQ